jgi:hypothetical protein
MIETHGLQRLFTVLSEFDVVATAPERDAQVIPDFGLVLRDKNRNRFRFRQ